MRDVLLAEKTATQLVQKIAPAYITITTAIAVLGVLFAVAIPQTPGGLRSGGDELAIAEHYAPVWYQEATWSDTYQFRQDYITRADFDGNWEMDDNWDDLPSFPLSGSIYYSVVQTATHWFITYTDFHPRDWKDGGCSSLYCHENDMEGAQLVVRRDGSQYGRLEIVETIYHDSIYKYYDPSAVTPREGVSNMNAALPVDGNGRPLLFVAAEGHPVRIDEIVTQGDGFFGSSRAECPAPAGDGMVYRYSGGVAEVPTALPCGDRSVSYSLLPIESELWSRRTWYDNNGHDKVYDDAGYYTGTRYSLPDRMGLSFNGDNYGDDKANPPWDWYDWMLQYGDWAIDPALTMMTHFQFNEPVGDQYEQNFYLFGPAGDEDLYINPENASNYFHVIAPDPSDIGTNGDCEYNNSNKWCKEGDGDPIGELHWPQHVIGCYEVSDDDRPGGEDCRYDDGHSNTLTYEWNAWQPQRTAEQIARILLIVNTHTSVCGSEPGYEDDDGLDYGIQYVELKPDSDPNKHWKFQKCSTGGSHGPMQFRALFDANNVFTGIEVRMGDHYDEGTMRVEEAHIFLNRCYDGTLYGECSVTKPSKCIDGSLVPQCAECGCPGSQNCNTQSGQCMSDGGSPIFIKLPASQEGRPGQ